MNNPPFGEMVVLLLEMMAINMQIKYLIPIYYYLHFGYVILHVIGACLQQTLFMLYFCLGEITFWPRLTGLMFSCSYVKLEMLVAVVNIPSESSPRLDILIKLEYNC